MLDSRGFGLIFKKMRAQFFDGGSFCVRINVCNSTCFVGEGLKKGIPFHPFFITLWRMFFQKFFFKAAQDDMIKGLLPGVVPGGVFSLQYADDTIIFLQ
jgi:hypothetical protein